MLVPISWLKDFVNIDLSIDELTSKLVGSGFEVEEVIDESNKIKNVVVGRIDSIEKHPNADKLQICQINVGSCVKQIVTGAHNIKVGDLVPVALDGAILAGGVTIKDGALRGVDSLGMLCSGQELGIDDYDYEGAEVYGILILKDGKPGDDINAIIGNDDYIMDVSVTANRPDCNSIIGIAREIAAVTNQRVKPFENINYNEIETNCPVKVTVDNSTLCPRYMAKEISNVKIMRSPKLIAQRLKKVGLRPINNIVDITNYILIEIGQPMHAFDKSFIDDIVVRNAKDGESIVTLDGKNNILSSDALVICNKSNPVAVAGIMGGLDSGINENTTDIIFEAARFAKESIRRTSRKLNLRSDSSARFEKGIDFASQQIAIDRAVTLIAKYGYGTIVKGGVDIKSDLKIVSKLEFTSSMITKIIGIVIPDKNILDILNSLCIETKKVGEKFISSIPEYREDIVCANDIAEELIRVYGYDKITSTMMDGARQTVGVVGDKIKFINKIKTILIAGGMYEIITYSFTTPKYVKMLQLPESIKPIKLINPLGEELSVMRTTLVHSMITTLTSNIAKGNKSACLFEYAKVFESDGMPLKDIPNQPNKLVIGMYGEDVDFYSLKSFINKILEISISEYTLAYSNCPYMHSGISADIFVGADNIGTFGEIHPLVLKNYDCSKKLYVAELDVDKLFELKKHDFKYENISKYQPVERDLALMVTKETQAASIIACIKKEGGTLLKNCNIFDVYQGSQIKQGYKSIAVKMEFSTDHTLTDEEITGVISTIVNALKNNIGAEVRDC